MNFNLVARDKNSSRSILRKWHLLKIERDQFRDDGVFSRLDATDFEMVAFSQNWARPILR
jgi:hypothetical protein